MLRVEKSIKSQSIALQRITRIAMTVVPRIYFTPKKKKKKHMIYEFEIETRLITENAKNIHMHRPEDIHRTQTPPHL